MLSEVCIHVTKISGHKCALCKETDSSQALASAAPLCASQYSVNITTATPLKGGIHKGKDSLFEQVQSTPLLAEPNRHCNVTQARNSRTNQWTWKSLDNVLSEGGATTAAPRIYASQANNENTLYRKDVFYSGSVYKLTETGDSVQDVKHHKNAKLLPVQWQKTKAMEFQETLTTDVTKAKKRTRVLTKVLDICAEMTNFTLFTDSLFLIYALSCTLTMFGEYSVNISLILREVLSPSVWKTKPQTHVFIGALL